MTKNLNTTKDKLNEAINNDPTFGTNSFNLSIVTSNPLPVVTVSLRVGKKHRATNFSGLTCLWGSGATYSMIKMKHTKHYERNMWYNKVAYITDNDVYCTTHDVKVPFCMPIFLAAR